MFYFKELISKALVSLLGTLRRFELRKCALIARLSHRFTLA
jgi:hypothetical protein